MPIASPILVEEVVPSSVLVEDMVPCGADVVFEAQPLTDLLS